MPGINNTYRLLLAIIIFIGVTACLLPDFVFNPGYVMPELGGDSAKNYFAYLWQVMHGGGMWFTGMNYPYGENLVYTDGQPFITLIVHLLKDTFHLDRNDVIALLFLAIAGAYITAMVYIYKILTHYRAPFIPAIIFSVFIVAMSPQQFRMFGHFGLGYLCIIPMLFYWLVLYHESKRLKYVVYFLMLGCIATFIHPYYILVCMLMGGMYSLCYWLLLNKGVKQKLKTTIPVLVAIGGIMAFVKGVMFFTDPVTDRPKFPWGFSQYRSTWQDIFNSDFSEFGKWITVPADGSEEGICYIGIIAMAVIVLSVIIGIIKLFLKKKKENDGMPVIPMIWLGVSVCCLLVAMGAPFSWDMEWLADHISFFRQFRAIGRLAMVYYYIASIYAAVVLCSWFVLLRKNKHTILPAYAMLLFCFWFWGTEVSGMVNKVRPRTMGRINLYNEHFWVKGQDLKGYLQERGYSKDSFQAVFMLPYTHVGSEKLWISGMRDWHFSLTTRAALNLDIPIVNVLMSRSSWSQTFKQVRMVSGPFADKPLLDDIKSDKPFLILKYEEDTLDPDSKYILQASEYLGFYCQNHIYAMYPKRLRELDKKYADSISPVLASGFEGDTCMNGYGFVADHFDDGNTTKSIYSAKAYSCFDEHEHVVGSYPVFVTQDSMLYELSLWTLVNDIDYRAPETKWYGTGAAGDTVFALSRYAAQSKDNNGMWLRVAQFTRLPMRCKKITCTILNSDKPDYIAYDELMIRPADALVISKQKTGTAMANNHLLKKK